MLGRPLNALDANMGLLVLGALIYLWPTAIAVMRRHHNRGAIAALNVLLGWTVLLWVGALVWALTAVEPRFQVAGHWWNRRASSRCWSCKEEVQPSASRCPHCGVTRQPEEED